MREIPFVKMSGTGNDFLMIDNRADRVGEHEKADFVRASAPRRTSAGADGVIFVEPSNLPGHDYRMRYFNADGGEADMCGNGSRCIAVFANKIGAANTQQTIETRAGTLKATVGDDGASARVWLSPPGELAMHENVALPGGPVTLYAMNTGVPHAIEFVPDVAAVDLKTRGATIRYHEVFAPAGTNANFVQVLSKDELRLRTYERGVEDETLACGTGATASAIIAAHVHGCTSPVKVHIASGDTLRIHFETTPRGARAPILEGGVKTVYKGDFYWP